MNVLKFDNKVVEEIEKHFTFGKEGFYIVVAISGGKELGKGKVNKKDEIPLFFKGFTEFIINNHTNKRVSFYTTDLVDDESCLRDIRNRIFDKNFNPKLKYLYTIEKNFLITKKEKKRNN